MQLRVARGGRQVTATCWLIHRQDGSGGTALYFVTAGHLFRTADGDRLPAADSIRVLLASGRIVEVQNRDVTLPGVAVVDIALLRTTVSDAVRDEPLPVSFTAPAPGTEFRVDGLDAAGGAIASSQRVRIKTSALLLGDREAATLFGCEGAPAMAAHAAFGLVVGCERDHVVVIALLELAEPFLRHHIQGFGATVRPTTELR
jgi:hypothetical protein